MIGAVRGTGMRFVLDEGGDLREHREVEARVAVEADVGRDHLLERRVAGALAEAGEGDVRLLAAVAPGRDGVRRREAEVVVAVELQLGARLAAERRDELRDALRQRGVRVGDAPADRVADAELGLALGLRRGRVCMNGITQP